MDASQSPSIAERLAAHPTVILNRAVKAHGGFGFDPARNELTSTKPALVVWISSRDDAAQIADHADKQAATPDALQGLSRAAKPAVTVKQPDASALTNFAAALAALAPQQTVDAEQVREIVAEQLAEAIAAMPPKVIELRSGSTIVGSIKGTAHPMVQRIAEMIGNNQRDRENNPTIPRLNPLLVGPMGCGKTTILRDVAKALGLPLEFIACHEQAEASLFLGYAVPNLTTGGTSYSPSAFVRGCENGALTIIDEIDGLTSGTGIFLNALVEADEFALPARPDKPTQSVSIKSAHSATANTWGTGATAVYCGRNQLDASTLDRFTPFYVDYDKAMELALAESMGHGHIARDFHRMREKMGNLRKALSTRGIAKECALMRAGFSPTEARAVTLAGWTKAELVQAGA